MLMENGFQWLSRVLGTYCGLLYTSWHWLLFTKSKILFIFWLEPLTQMTRHPHSSFRRKNPTTWMYKSEEDSFGSALCGLWSPHLVTNKGVLKPPCSGMEDFRATAAFGLRGLHRQDEVGLVCVLRWLSICQAQGGVNGVQKKLIFGWTSSTYQGLCTRRLCSF